MVPTIVPVYAAIFALMLVGLSVRVANTRREAGSHSATAARRCCSAASAPRATSPNTCRWR